MDPAIMGAIVIACCFAAGVFSERGRGSDARDARAERTGRDERGERSRGGRR